MARRIVLSIVLAAAALVAAVVVSTVATVETTRPDRACPDPRWGCAEFEADENVTIGVLLPTTGREADRGAAELAAVEEAVGDAPRVFGRPFEVVHRDDACTYEAASEAARIFATTESPTRPPTAVVVGGICREAVQPAAQILTDTGVAFVSWFDEELEFASPAPRLFFYVPLPDGARDPARAAEIAVESVRDVAIRGPDGTIYVPRMAVRDALARAVRALATP